MVLGITDHIYGLFGNSLLAYDLWKVREYNHNPCSDSQFASKPAIFGVGMLNNTQTGISCFIRTLAISMEGNGS